MLIEWGGARATASLSGGGVSSVAVTNPGFGFTLPPIVRFFGGGTQIGFGNQSYSNFVGAGQPTYPAPQNPATAHCIMSGSAGALTVASIVVDNAGSGYVVPPFVFLENSILDPNGCADPSHSGGSGDLIPGGGGNIYLNGTACTTDALAVYSLAASGPQSFSCRWME